MWKKQDDVEGAQPDSPSKQQRDATKLLGVALGSSSSTGDEFKNRNLAVASDEVHTERSDQPLQSPTMKTYTEAVKEFTKNATSFIEQLPLLAKARAAYEEATRASAEMRKVLDASDENLRTLMTQLEQKANLREVQSGTERKPPEPAKVERMTGTEEGGGRTYRWP